MKSRIYFVQEHVVLAFMTKIMIEHLASPVNILKLLNKTLLQFAHSPKRQPEPLSMYFLRIGLQSS